MGNSISLKFVAEVLAEKHRRFAREMLADARARGITFSETDAQGRETRRWNYDTGAWESVPPEATPDE